MNSVSHLSVSICVCSAWRYEAGIGLYSTPASPHPQDQTAHPRWQQFSLSGASGSLISHASSQAAAVDDKAAVHTDNVQLAVAEQQELAEHSNIRSNGKAAAVEQPTTKYEGSYSLSGSGPGGATQADKQEGAAVDKPPSAADKEPSRQQLSHENGSKHPVAVPSPRMQAALHTIPQAADAANSEEEENSQQLVSISAQHVGTYAFKGCGMMELVCLTSDAMPVTQQTLAVAPPRGSKGVLISAASGPVVGLQDYAVMLPNVLPQFKQAWEKLGSGANLAYGVRPQAAVSTAS
eukprot:GHUV01015903.1.p3 GENE.GHUV01015903.1~~GHUV01015903.1.p3  ORF type:complete len:293 (+),score=91.35 GHUV01015903.1:8244-9122(+)